MAKIMLVEDDNNLREIYGARLMAEGYEIVSAQDGEEALAIAVKEKPDLIISDVMMPRISGFDMLDILRNAPETKDTKVIMMTALSQAEDKSRADKLGADRYLVKSQVTLEDVTNVVHEVLGDAPSDGPTPAADTPAAESPSATPQPAPPTVENIANPDIKVAGDPNPGEVQAPPAPETSAPEVPPATPPVIPAPNPAQFEPQTPPLTTPSADNTSDASQNQAVPPAAPPSPAPTSSPTTATTPDPTPAAAPAQPEPPIVPPANTVSAVPGQQTNTSASSDVVQTSSDDNTTSPPPATASSTDEELNLDDIKVELQTPAEAAEASPAPGNTEPSSTPATTEPPVGPTLAEALASEEQQLASDKADNESPAAPAQPTAPTVANGAPVPTVVTPTKIEVTTPPEETSSATTPEPANPSTPPPKTTGERVIQPLNEPGTTPDLQALLAAEEQKEAVNNPGATSVITPQAQEQQAASDQPQSQKPSTDLNNIAI